MDDYYELLEADLSDNKLKKAMEQLIAADPDFYDPYLTVFGILQEQEKESEARALLYGGYVRAMKRVVDKAGNLPKSLPWLWLENRHIIRIIDAWAFDLWENGQIEESLTIYRKLLRSNPHDNIGARNHILAMRLELGIDYEDRFLDRKMPGYMDAFKVMDWFDKQSKKFPDEFDWWRKEVEREEEETDEL